MRCCRETPGFVLGPVAFVMFQVEVFAHVRALLQVALHINCVISYRSCSALALFGLGPA